MDHVQPDAESLLVRFLAGHEALIPLHGGRVGTDLNPEGIYPAIRVTFISGNQPQPWEWTARLQVECWGTTREDASTLARTTVAALDDITGAHPEGEVRGWAALLPFPSPGPAAEGGRARFLVPSLTLHLFPTYVPVPEF